MLITSKCEHCGREFPNSDQWYGRKHCPLCTLLLNYRNILLSDADAMEEAEFFGTGLAVVDPWIKERKTGKAQVA